MATQNILVVEDHSALRAVLVETLEAAGHHVVAVDCAEAVAEYPVSQRFDIAVIDLNLPGEDGLSLTTRLRKTCPELGIILVTVRDAVDDKLRGYAGGADLYLTKPIDANELLFALSALARRLSSSATDTSVYQLDPLRTHLLTPEGTMVRLTRREVQVLHAFALAPNSTLETWQLLEILHLDESERAKQNLEVLISRLRSKFRAHGIDPTTLQTERAVGYVLTLPIEIR